MHDSSILFYLLYFAVLLNDLSVNSLHLSGKWKTQGFYLFLAKFGFQKTDPGKLADTQGFIYGNVTANSPPDSYYTLVLADSEYFIELHGNSTLSKENACSRMFNKIDTIAFDSTCNPKGLEDFIRHVPCPQDKLCIDEDTPSNVLPEYQFTYKVQDNAQPRFWYLSMVACHKNTSNKNCSWFHNSSINTELNYDIWLVNGDPASKHLNPFEHQFSFEMHDVFEIYLIFSILYGIILPVWIYAFKKQLHPITKILTVCISAEFTGVAFNLIHVFIFAFNGVGADWLKVIGNLLGMFAECLFVLLLLLIAKGWTVTSMKLTSKYTFFGVWGVYSFLNAMFFIWNLTEIDIITNKDEWNSWPGYVLVGVRMVIMIWFIVELRRTFRQSQHPDRLDFFQQFGAYYLVWFIYLPILVLVATQISFLWRYKTILSITYAADTLSYIVLIHLLWPSRSVLYLIKGDAPLPQYDLEAIGLIEPDSVMETVFESPRKKRSTAAHVPNHTDSKTNLLSDPDSLSDKSMDSGGLAADGYINVNLDEDRESEFELL